MIDDLIETHIKQKIAQAYTSLDMNQVIVKFPLSVFERAHNKRGAYIGAERLTVMAIIANGEKLDRTALIKLMPRCIINFGDTAAEQNYIRAEQKDFIELIQTKGLIFTIQYLYDI